MLEIGRFSIDNVATGMMARADLRTDLINGLNLIGDHSGPSCSKSG